MPLVCGHPRERRSLLNGYEILCDECGEAVGRVALHPCAVFTAGEAATLLERLGDDGESRPDIATTKLRNAAFHVARV